MPATRSRTSSAEPTEVVKDTKAEVVEESLKTDKQVDDKVESKAEPDSSSPDVEESNSEKDSIEKEKVDDGKVENGAKEEEDVAKEKNGKPVEEESEKVEEKSEETEESVKRKADDEVAKVATPEKKIKLDTVTSPEKVKLDEGKEEKEEEKAITEATPVVEPCA